MIKVMDTVTRYELIKTDAGFMAYDHDCDEFLYDRWNNNTFDTDIEANKLIEDAVYTNIELED